MRKFIYFAVIGWFILFAGDSRAESLEAVGYSQVELNSSDRVLVMAPHPDDEVLGCAGIIQKALAMKLPVKIMFYTYGDSNEWAFLIYRKRLVLMPKAVQAMGQIRRSEAIAAAKVFGVSPQSLVFLGYPDFRTLAIWLSHWGQNRPAARSILTGTRSVPYHNALTPGAAYKGEDILADIKTVLREFKPTKIFLSHPADHNGDHQTLYLFTRVALWDLAGEVEAKLYPYLVHFVNWPKPRGMQLRRPLTPPEFFGDTVQWHNNYLKANEVEVKLNAIKAHVSQFKSSRNYLLTFIRPNELFGDFEPIVLRNTVSVLLPAIHEAVDIPQELTDEQKALFVGFEERYVYLEGRDLVISIKLTRPVEDLVGISIYIFGYRKDKPFVEMPKLRFKFGALSQDVLDQTRMVSKDHVNITRNDREITIRVPLALLGNPEKMLTSAQTYVGTLPLDQVSWRILEMPREKDK